MPDSLDLRAVPFWFGEPGTPLFGWLHPPGGESRSTAIVVVSPLGYEAICSHRALRCLATRVASSGFPVLRYDHPGCGDSAGGAGPSDVDDWLDGVARAIDTVKKQSGASRVALIGLRVGALLALAAAERRADIASVVLWAPPRTGRDYVREIRALGGFASVARSRAAPAHEEIAGFAFSTQTLEGLARIDPRRIVLPPGSRLLVIPRDDVPAPPGDPAPWPATAEVRPLPGYGSAMRDPHEASIAGELLDGVATWLEAAHPERAPTTRVAAKSRVVLGARPRIVEDAVHFGPNDRLFGIVTLPIGPRPLPPAPAAEPCVLWLNAGAIHRIGMNRNYVTLARDWANRGIMSLRFDVGGLGDSSVSGEAPRDILYSPEVVADVRAAMDFMERTRGARKFVLAGLCAGAYAAFHSALADERVVSAVMINPQTLYFTPGDPLAVGRRRAYRSAQWYRRSAGRSESWRRALRGQVDWIRVARLLGEWLVSTGRSRIKAIRAGDRPTALTRAFEQLSRRGTRVLLVFSSDDPGLDYMRSELAGRLSALERDPSFALEVIDGPDHTFTPVWSQRALAKCLTRYVARWHGISGDETPSNAEPAAASV